MRLLKRLFRERPVEFTDRIWSTTDQKLDDLVAQIRGCQRIGGRPIAVAHFETTRQRVLESFRKSGLTAQVVSSPSQFLFQAVSLQEPGDAIPLLASDAIPPAVHRVESIHSLPVSHTPVSVHLAEHYPIASRDQVVLTLATIWSCQIEFACYTALDEPWLAPFGMERVRSLLERLRLDEGAALTHPTLHRALLKAQQRIGDQIAHEQRCDSCEEWMRCNLGKS